MFIDPARDDHGLVGNPLYALIVPRPIGWISTRALDGRTNLAPYSFFNMVSDEPPLVLFSSDGPKDTATFAQESGEFVVNLVSEPLAQAMNHTAIDAPRGVSEFTLAAVGEAPCRLIEAPRVREAFASLECRVTDVWRPRDVAGQTTENIIVVGQVLGIHLDDAVVHEGRIDIARSQPVARLGYLDFTVVREAFRMRRPKWGE